MHQYSMINSMIQCINIRRTECTVGRHYKTDQYWHLS